MWIVAWEQILINNKSKDLKENINKCRISHYMVHRLIVITLRLTQHNHICCTLYLIKYDVQL